MSREREILEVDVLFVGAGPASLSGAIRLMQLQAEHNKKVAEKGAGEKKDLMVAVIEKSAGAGFHNLSGAVLDPRGLEILFPDWESRDVPVEAIASSHEVRYLLKKKSVKSPITPPPLANKGYPIVSLSRFTQWLAKRAEEMGVNIFDHFPGSALLWEDGKVAGVRCQDRGLNKAGQPKESYEPGAEIRSPLTVLGEGTRGSLTKELVKKKDLLAGKNPQGYALGIKEVWKIRPEKFRSGHVIHTMGFPLGMKTFGGGFIYQMKDNLVSLGLVISLDYHDPLLDPYAMMQRFKTHPFVASLLDGGERIAYGAKTIPEGGYYAMPKPAVDGCMIVGDSAGFVNAQRIKGIHLAMESGIAAADNIWKATEEKDFSERSLSRYSENIMSGRTGKELRKVRNFHQAFHNGLGKGFVKAALQYVTFGRGLKDPIRVVEDARSLVKVSPAEDKKTALEGEQRYDGKLTFSREDNLYLSGTEHEEDQPCHLEVPDTSICYGKCREEFGNPCRLFCPAQVYEFVEEGGNRRLQINFANCLHCKTCDIKDPYGNIVWHCPEAGGGPHYTIM